MSESERITYMPSVFSGILPPKQIGHRRLRYSLGLESGGRGGGDDVGGGGGCVDDGVDRVG
jgi:hypothetical protein